MADLHAVPAADNVPGVMRCDVCKFELTRVNLNVNVGTVTAGDLSPEPCPNGCGTLRPTTWKERANDADKAAEGLFDRAFAAEKERDALRGLWLEWLDGMYDGKDLLRRVKLAVHGPLRKPGNAGVTVDSRTCTCHPDDNPPKPCPRKFSLSECRAADGVTGTPYQTFCTNTPAGERAKD